MAMNKSVVYSHEDLQIYLQEKAKESQRLYHYTTYESLICILKNKSFRLSRLDLLNDRAEQKLGNLDNETQNYIMSFTREKEYVSMWAMYGKPSGIKIRLDFPMKKFVETINNNFFKDSLKKEKIELYSNNSPANPIEEKERAFIIAHASSEELEHIAVIFQEIKKVREKFAENEESIAKNMANVINQTRTGMENTN